MISVLIFVLFGTLIMGAPQGGEFGGGSGGGAGGLFDGHHHHHSTIIGLSRGIEIHHGHGHNEGGNSGGSGGSGGGGAGGSGEGGNDHHHHHSIGFTGSHFNTPVDVHHEEVVHLKAHPEYHYDYHVADHHTKDYKSKHEIRDGYKVKGSYSLLEPDHKTIRVVDYVSDKKQGFIAKVTLKKHE